MHTDSSTWLRIVCMYSLTGVRAFACLTVSLGLLMDQLRCLPSSTAVQSVQQQCTEALQSTDSNPVLRWLYCGSSLYVCRCVTVHYNVCLKRSTVVQVLKTVSSGISCKTSFNNPSHQHDQAQTHDKPGSHVHLFDELGWNRHVTHMSTSSEISKELKHQSTVLTRNTSEVNGCKHTEWHVYSSRAWDQR